MDTPNVEPCPLCDEQPYVAPPSVLSARMLAGHVSCCGVVVETDAMENGPDYCVDTWNAFIRAARGPIERD